MLFRSVTVTYTMSSYEFPIAGDYTVALYVVDNDDRYECSDYLDDISYEFKGVKAPALVLTGANGTDFTTDDGITYNWNADFTALTGKTVNFTVKVIQGNQPRCLADFSTTNYPASPAKIQVSTEPQNECYWVESGGVRQLQCTENWNTSTSSITYWQTAGDSYTLYDNVSPQTVSKITINPVNTASSEGNSVTMSVSVEP